MTKTIDIPKGCKLRVVTFGGREWTVVKVPWKTKPIGALKREVTAHIDEDMAIIMFRSYNLDLARIALLHELLHFSFPELNESAFALGDSMFKSSLDAFGVNLDALLEGYE